MGNHLARVEKRCKNRADLSEAEVKLKADPTDLELRIDIIRAYQFFFTENVDTDKVCDSIIWIIENRPDAEVEAWYEFPFWFLRSTRRAEAIHAWKKSICSSNFSRSILLKNAAIFAEIVDLDFCIKCRETLFLDDCGDFDNKFEFAKVLIYPSHLRTEAPSDPLKALALFQEIMGDDYDKITVEIASCACRSALVSKNKSDLIHWVDVLKDKLREEGDTLAQIFKNEALGILARSYLYLDARSKFVNTLNILKTIPII
jgi:hypothetical protein